MKKIKYLYLLLILTLQANAAAIIDTLTADFDVIVVIVDTDSSEPEPSEQASAWKINNIQPVSIGRYSYVNHEGLPVSNVYPITVRHHMYLRMAQPLSSGTNYTIETPYTNTSLNFNETQTLSEAIKVNQEGYFPGGHIRYANLAIYLGSLGNHQLSSAPNYKVYRESDNTLVLSGNSTDLGIDAQSAGDYVYQMSLSTITNGGPYYISVPGLGRSHSFSINNATTEKISKVFFRGLYHQRCGTALESAYTDHIRGICHVTAQVTDAEPPLFIHLNGPSRTIIGGYHDAADFDRRQSHTLIPAWVLNLYDAFPEKFSDNEYNLPDLNNGIPDVLDEAMWGVLLWENLQEADGGVRAGTEANHHPTYGVVAADTDNLTYRTYRRDGHATASAVGMFAQAARLIAPFNAQRAAELETKALAAWNWLQQPGNHPANNAQIMYGALQLYLLTGQSIYHNEFISRVSTLATAGWPEQYHTRYYSLGTIVQGMIFTPYFTSYLYTNRSTDTQTKNILMGWLQEDAQYSLNLLNNRAYPMGAESASWGSVTAQGRYADPMIYLYRVNNDPAYIDAISQLADYSLGLNPVGKTYVTGLGKDTVENILHADSYFTKQNGLGNVPGITIFGPNQVGNMPWEVVIKQHVYPSWNSMPDLRKYSDGWSLVPVNEFSTWEVTAPNAIMHAFLKAMLVQSDLIFKDGFE